MFSELIGKLVEVEWVDEADWPYFTLLAVENGFVHLQGADYPDGSGKHRGDRIWVKTQEIRSIRAA